MKVLLIQGHPDRYARHFCHALAEAYAQAAKEAGHELRILDVAALDFPLWLGDMPARLKGFFEQVLRPGFAIGEAAPGGMWKKLLKGRSARIVVTMGMPAFFYRLYYRSHSVKSLKRNILEFCGFSPVRTSFVGTVETKAQGVRETWLVKMRMLGAAAR